MTPLARGLALALLFAVARRVRQEVPLLAFRSLSDLAGGGLWANEIRTFGALGADHAALVLRAFLRQWRGPCQLVTRRGGQWSASWPRRSS